MHFLKWIKLFKTNANNKTSIVERVCSDLFLFFHFKFYCNHNKNNNRSGKTTKIREYSVAIILWINGYIIEGERKRTFYFLCTLEISHQVLFDLQQNIRVITVELRIELTWCEPLFRFFCASFEAHTHTHTDTLSALML